MAEDDPYNFEIAIPAGGGGAKASNAGRYGYSDDDEDDDRDEEDDDDNSVDVSASYGESSPEAVVKSRARAKEQPKPAAKPSAGGGSSALDKAKSFLSKYSTKGPVQTKASSSSSRRRLELSMDEDDLSLDSSRDVSRGRGRDQSSDEDDEDDISPLKTKAQASALSTRTPAPVPKPTTYSDDEEFDEEEEEAPPPYTTAATASGSSVRNAPSAVTTAPSLSSWRPTTAREPDNNDDQSIEAESIVSQSEIIESHDQSGFHDPSPVLATPIAATNRATPLALQSAPSESGAYESGAYEEDGFDEESKPASPQRQPVVAARTEATFDYSMDFSDDGGDESAPSGPAVSKMPESVKIDAPLKEQEEPVSEGEEEQSDGARSELLESSGESNGPAPVQSYPPQQEDNTEEEDYASVDLPETSPVPLSVIHERASSFQMAEPIPAPIQRQEPDVGITAINIRGEQAPPPPLSTNKAPELSNRTAATEHLPQPKQVLPTANDNFVRVDPTTRSWRSQVTIVRAYDTSTASKPEMVDASTQYTGNHAGIQTDLVPDGMLNLLEPRPRSQTHQETDPNDKNNQPSSTIPQHQTLPPAPQPESTRLPTPSYSMDLLYASPGSSTSFYKQQLFALQQQILEKKRETERLVTDRMNFRYSSLRGTERFIAGRRPAKLPLWEALMQVDPSLDENKAKEVARLAQGGHTA